MKTNRGSSWRYHSFWIDFCCDGMFKKPRIKRREKRILGKKSRKVVRKNSEME